MHEICQDQNSREFLSACKATESSCDEMRLKILTSSANNMPWDSIFSRRSLIYTTKRIGPRTLPWGMPLSTKDDIDSEPFTFTTCVQPLRKAFIQFSSLPFMPYNSSLPISLRWGTQSKAFETSK